MNIPMSWLKEYVEIPKEVTTKVFLEDITMSGSKVETCEEFGTDIKNVVVGKVVSIEKHPDADKLVVTQIDTGNETLQIVTGATNLYEGAIVPVALDGSVLAGGVKIKKGKLRGVESNGMLCSIEELGQELADFPEAPENGIYIFPEEVPLGMDATQAMDIVDEVVEYEITSNRPDCFSVLGIARETAATYNVPLKAPQVTLKEEIKEDVHSYIDVEIKNAELCPRYIARVVKDVKIEPSPRWMRKRLRMAGLRPINNIVDITNYVMLELGQPMHAFDIDMIDERKIIVRNAEDGEKITTLDGEEHTLSSEMLVIADCNKAVAIAGVMGGENSMVSGNAQAILFESANFNGPSIRITAKKLGMRTDASSKYEKGIDPELAQYAVDRAVQLVEMIGAGKVVQGSVDCYPNPRKMAPIAYSPKRINDLLGTDISPEDMALYMERVDIAIDRTACVATPPTFRPDLEREADLAEEVGRLYGYNRIEETLSIGRPTVGKKTFVQQVESIIKDVMVAQGYFEAKTYSFESPKVFDKLLIPQAGPERKAIEIANPLGEDYSVMRTQAVNGILQSLGINYNRRNKNAYLYEIGKIYLPKALPLTEMPVEKPVLTLGGYGAMDFYDMKGTLDELFSVLGLSVQYVPDTRTSYMHPGRTAALVLDSQLVGFIGEVHPVVQENYEIKERVYLAVIELQEDLIEKVRISKKYKELPKYPAITRDIALLVPEEVYAKQIEDLIHLRGGKLLETVALFDIYTGAQIKENYKSMAYSLTFRAQDRTLVDEDVNKVMKKILQGLEEMGVTLRDK